MTISTCHVTYLLESEAHSTVNSAVIDINLARNVLFHIHPCRKLVSVMVSRYSYIRYESLSGASWIEPIMSNFTMQSSINQLFTLRSAVYHQRSLVPKADISACKVTFLLITDRCLVETRSD